MGKEDGKIITYSGEFAQILRDRASQYEDELIRSLNKARKNQPPIVDRIRARFDQVLSILGRSREVDFEEQFVAKTFRQLVKQIQINGSVIPKLVGSIDLMGDVMDEKDPVTRVEKSLDVCALIAGTQKKYGGLFKRKESPFLDEMGITLPFYSPVANLAREASGKKGVLLKQVKSAVAAEEQSAGAVTKLGKQAGSIESNLTDAAKAYEEGLSFDSRLQNIKGSIDNHGGEITKNIVAGRSVNQDVAALAGQLKSASQLASKAIDSNRRTGDLLRGLTNASVYIPTLQTAKSVHLASIYQTESVAASATVLSGLSMWFAGKQAGNVALMNLYLSLRLYGDVTGGFPDATLATKHLANSDLAAKVINSTWRDPR